MKKGQKATPEEIEKNRLGHLGKKLSPSTIVKMKVTRNTPEYLAKISRSLKGIGKGVPKSEDHKLKIGLAQKGVPKSAKAKKNMSLSKKGRTDLNNHHLHSQKTKNLLSQMRIGKESSRKGVILSKEIKNKISKTLKGQFVGDKNPMYGKPPKWKGSSYLYISPLQGNVWLRSSYELVYAKYLDSINELWLYEFETFEIDNGNTYTPDFFLPKREKFIEIKGFPYLKGQNKISLFKEQYPFDLEVLFKEDLLKLGLKVK